MVSNRLPVFIALTVAGQSAIPNYTNPWYSHISSQGGTDNNVMSMKKHSKKMSNHHSCMNDITNLTRNDTNKF